DDGSDFKGNSTHGNGTHGAVPFTHILPATYTFGIWGLIYALLGGFVIYQWFNSAEIATVEGVKFYLILANIGNIVWIVLWRKDVVFAGTLAWSLIGIAVRQFESLPILIAAAVSAGLII
ncbi:11125_t:CDS:2, partial [Racocetra fulgida]